MYLIIKPFLLGFIIEKYNFFLDKQAFIFNFNLDEFL